MTNILIVGTGALGTLFAARLSAAGNNVTLLGTWPEALTALNQHGARLILAEGSELRAPVQATDTPANCSQVDLALVLVKAWQTKRAAQQLAACLPATSVAVTLQNGLGNREILIEALGQTRVILGVCTYGATLLAPGVAQLGGEGLLALEDTPRSREIQTLLQRAGFQVNLVADAEALAWGKVIINAAINPLTALLRVPNGELLQRPAARALMQALAEETAAIAQAHGIQLPFKDPLAAVENVAQRTASNRSSMLQDIQRGAPTEIEAICGAVTRIAQTHGISAPLNWAMWRLIDALRGA
ncbi:MAG: 2-dehydropantoate 2-reductase [Anaerolineae bacterium]|nr:MAG: 2-dehydropantoate 2-reductase [Anaerolineae bacterium]